MDHNQIQQLLNEQLTALRQEFLTTLHNQEIKFNVELQAKQNAIDALTIKNLKSSSNPYGKEKVKEPQMYSGKRDKTEQFLYQVDIVFAAQKQIYSTDEAKIRYAASFMDSAAAKWAQTQTKNKSFENKTYLDFKKLLIGAFGKTDPHNESLAKLRSLKQKGPCTDYTTQFNVLASETHLDDPSLVDFFKLGLKWEILDLMITLPNEPTGLADFQEKAILFDNRLWDRKQARKLQNPVLSNKTVIPKNSPVKEVATPMDLDSIQVMITNAVQTAVGQTSYKPRGPLTSEQREHRRLNKLCLYCGGLDCGGTTDTKECKILKLKNSGKGRGQN